MSGRMRGLAVTGLAVLAVAACGDGAGPSANSVSLSFSSVRPAGVAPSPSFRMSGVSASVMAPGDSLVLTDGTNTLIITSAQVLMREIELKRVNVLDCDSTANPDACEKFELGAMLVSLPLVAGAATEVAITVDSGSYSEIEFDVHKLGTDSTDNVFHVANPTWPVGQSIRVTGFYNGTPFTFVTDVDAEQEIQFNPALVSGPGGSLGNVTIRFDLDQWFRTSPTGPFINPATANQGGANKSLVDNNIKNRIDAFEDDDQDGDERDG